MRTSLCIAICALLAARPLMATPADSSPPAVAALIDAIAMKQDPRVAAALARMDGLDRRLLALRAYLRAGAGLADRWSWTSEQIATFAQSEENRAMQVEIDKVRRAFTAANPGFQLWVNPEVRSLDSQLATWNRNASVASAAAQLLESFDRWRQSPAVAALPSAELPIAATRFLKDFIPTPTPTPAAPGLSPHGQMRAIDFHIKQGGRTVADPDSATIARDWDGAGWAKKLAAAVSAGSTHFTGPLPLPREPWHYNYVP